MQPDGVGRQGRVLHLRRHRRLVPARARRLRASEQVPRPTSRRRRWNAKFGYLSPDLPLKYPMHYVPEGLMLFLSLAGLPAILETPKGKEA